MTLIDHARAADTTDQAVIATDASGAIVYWGRHAEALYEWTSGEVLGRNILDVTATELSRAEGERIMETLQGGASWSGEFIVHTRRGQRFLAVVQDVPVRGADGEFAGVVGVSRRAAYLDAPIGRAREAIPAGG